MSEQDWAEKQARDVCIDGLISDTHPVARRIATALRGAEQRGYERGARDLRTMVTVIRGLANTRRSKAEALPLHELDMARALHAQADGLLEAADLLDGGTPAGDDDGL